jgi:hypothetical protein
MRIARFTLVATLLSVTSLSCTASLQELCGRRVPALDREISEALVKLGPTPGGRALASEKGPVAPLSDADRDEWLAWTEKKLREAQITLDDVAAYPQARELRQDLSDMANDLVAFHGYAQAGKAAPMASMLERIQTRSRKAAARACGREFALDAARPRP